MKRLVLLTIALLLAASNATAGGLTRIAGTGVTTTGKGINVGKCLAKEIGGRDFEEDYSWEIGPEVIIPKFSFNGKHSNDQVFHALPYVEYAKKLRDDLIFNCKVDTPYGLGSTFDDNPQQLGYDTKTLISGTYFTVGLSQKISDKLSISLGGIFCWSQFDYRAPFDVGRVPLPIFTESEGDGFGWGGTIGLFYTPSDNLALALNYTSRIKTEIAGTTKVSIGPFRFADQFDSAFTFPDKLELGLALKLNEKWVVTGDVGFCGYSKTPNNMSLKFHDLPLTKSNSLKWQDIWYAHIASTHAFGKNSQWQIRYGGGYMSCAIPDETMSTLTMDVPGWDVTLGVGWQGKRLSVDANYTLGWGENEVERGLFAGKYRAQIHTVSVALSW